jgi:tagatose 6-phosphate kinase
MILAVTLNPALDLTYAVDALVPHTTHRVTAVTERAGGKGLNVASVLHALGEPVLATGLLGGATGDRIADLLARDGIPASFRRIAAGSRRTVAVADGLDATGFWEPGPTVTAGEWRDFVAHFRGLLPGASVAVLSGSLPPGVPVEGYATLLALATDAGVRTILDTSGEPLRAGLGGRPDLVKPNAAELAALTGDPGLDARSAADHALALGARAVVLSRGELGLLAVTPDGVFEAAPPETVAGNPTGAGDACVAALARGLAARTPWVSLVADAAALSAAAVAAPIAGVFDADAYRRWTDTTP